jgi:LAS superfamily LD-carboxypeptidase LdcB
MEGKPEQIKIDKELVINILQKCEHIFGSSEANLISVEEIKEGLDEKEKDLIDYLLSLTPKDLGVDLKHWGGKEAKAEDFVRISGQEYTNSKMTVGENGEEIPDLENSENKIIRDQFLPEIVHNNFTKLRVAMEGEIGKTVLVQSGFRSYGYQLLVFLNYLKSKNFDIYKTAKLVAIPGFSEHEDKDYPAIDFLDPQNRKFKDTEQFEWMKQNAESFGFKLSFPEGNKNGIQFEPWHWKYNLW